MSPLTAIFEDVKVFVMDGVYEPEDDTFLLCEHLEVKPGDRFLEVGTGCGLVAILAAKRGAYVVATDQSPLAVKNAKENVKLHNLQEKIEIRQGWLFEPIRQNERFSIIAFNPPYLPGTHLDPAYNQAWSGGKTGREITEAFLIQCTKFLDAEGHLLLIQSSLSDSEKTYQMLKTQFHDVIIKGERKSFFERIILYKAERPYQIIPD
jgi:release factor glutamine methyltransferase